MKLLKSLQLIMVLTISLITLCSSKAQTTISLDNFKVLDDTSWKGTLTYLDYKSGEPVLVSTTMQIKITDNTIEQDVQYTWEPHKNVGAITKIKKNGTHLGKQKVISKTVKDDGTLQLITTYEGKDDDKKATMFFTYEFNGDTYKVTKEVQFEGSNERFMRNNYIYMKIN